MTEIDINRPTLDSFFSSSPVIYTKKLKRITFINEFNGKEIQGYIYKGQKCLTLNDLADYIPRGKYNTTKKAFQRAISDYDMKEGIDYERVDGELFSPSSKGKGEYIYLLYRTGALLTLANMSKKYKAALLYRLVHYYFQEEDLKTEYSNYRPKNVLLLPTMGDKHYSKNLDLVDSRGEQIVADILFDLGIPYQVGVRFYKLGLIPDFVIKTEPYTVIEYWGVRGDTGYQNKRQWKEKQYNYLGWTLICIEAHEVDNIPKLRARLMKLLE